MVAQEEWAEGLEILLDDPRVDVQAVARETDQGTETLLEIAERIGWEEGVKLVRDALVRSEIRSTEHESQLPS